MRHPERLQERGPLMPSPSEPISAGPTSGGFVRKAATVTGHITRDGPGGSPAQPGRYQLYACLACPWSQRALIVRSLLGLDRVIGLSLTDPISGEHGWRVPDAGGGVDPVT